MGIVDYLEQGDAEKGQIAKDELVDYIVNLEGVLDEAEVYGKEGSMKMLDLLKEFSNIDEDLEYYAKRANEPVPMRNYHTEVGKLVMNYLPNILKKEFDQIEKYLAENPDDTDEAIKGLQKMEEMISFYGDIYPKLDLTFAKERLKEINSHFEEVEG